MIRVDEHISLELIKEHHASAAFTLLNENREYLAPWIPTVTQVKTLDDFYTFLKGVKKRHDERQEKAFVITRDGILIGKIGLYYIDHQNRIAKIGYWIGEQHQGQGVITKCCRALIDYAFNILELNRIEIKCATENKKSQEIPERLGFTREGVMREGELHQDKFLDMFLYAILRCDWPVN